MCPERWQRRHQRSLRGRGVENTYLAATFNSFQNVPQLHDSSRFAAGYQLRHCRPDDDTSRGSSAREASRCAGFAAEVLVSAHFSVAPSHSLNGFATSGDCVGLNNAVKAGLH